MVVDGAAAVIVIGVNPRHEQALEYRTALEQLEAYVGTAPGITATSRRKWPPLASAVVVLVLVVTVVDDVVMPTVVTVVT
jgi:hypothetical protein